MSAPLQGGAELLEDPAAQELLHSTNPAHLAYAWTDGTPRCTPIWFHWTGSEVVMAGPPNAPKVWRCPTARPLPSPSTLPPGRTRS